MWFGKVAIIFYIFSVGSLFFTYYINTAINDPIITNSSTSCTWSVLVVTPHSCTSFDGLTVLAGSYKLNQQVNTSLIFGDFLAGATVFFQLFTGQTVANAFTIIPFVDASITLLMNIVFALSSVALWIYIIANRSI